MLLHGRGKLTKNASSTYAAALETLSESLSGTSKAEAFEAVVELDLNDLAVIQPPRGYGRD